jgi:hypothetical protein
LLLTNVAEIIGRRHVKQIVGSLQTSWGDRSGDMRNYLIRRKRPSAYGCHFQSLILMSCCRWVWLVDAIHTSHATRPFVIPACAIIVTGRHARRCSRLRLVMEDTFRRGSHVLDVSPLSVHHRRRLGRPMLFDYANARDRKISQEPWYAIH